MPVIVGAVSKPHGAHLPLGIMEIVQLETAPTVLPDKRLTYHQPAAIENAVKRTVKSVVRHGSQR